MYKHLSKDYFSLVLLIIFIIPLFYQLIRPGFFPMQDDLQAFRVHQMVKCLQDFQIPCRWIPDMGYQYGYPQFNYYPPSAFYLGAILNIIGISILDTVKILFILGFLFAALAIYILLKTLTSSWPAFLGAVLYSYVPFKAAEVYVRGSLNEFWAFVFFPLILWASYQLILLGKLRYLLWLSLSIGLLLLTHNLMSLIFLPIFGVWVFTLIFIYKKWDKLAIILISFLLGLGLAAFFVIPVVFEGKFVHLETLTGGYFDYRQHFVNLRQLFLSNHFGYGSSYLGPNDDLSLSTGIVHWILGVLAVVLALIFWKSYKKLSYLVFIMAILEMFVLFMMHQKSSFIWENVSFLAWMQFPWRLLAVSTFILSVLGSITLYLIYQFNKRLGKILGIILVLLLFVMHASFFQPKEWLDISDREKFSGQSWEKQLTISIFDYLPIYAKLPPNKKAPQLPEVLEGEADFISYKKGSNYQIGEMNVKKEAILRLPLFYFPGMTVEIDKQKTAIRYDDCRNQEYCLGLVTFNIKEGKHITEAKLQDTPVRRMSNIITVICLLIFAAVFILNKKYERHHN